MVCIFCIAVIALIAGALTAAQVDEVESKLADKADGDVRRTVDSESVAKFELKVRVGGRSVPVAITVFKDHGRVRIQILSHDLKAEEIEELEDELAEALDAEIVDRQDGSAEAEHDHGPSEEEAEAEREAEKQRSAQAQAEAQRKRPRG